MAEKLKTYDELTFADDFMFCKILQNHPDLCRELTELILGREIGSIVLLEKQHPIEITSDGHGVRFDIYMKDDEGTRYDIEMQTVTFSALPKRTRYYHSMIDLEALERGVGYQKLPNSCVIFICMENPFRQYGLHKYTFSGCCEEDRRLMLNDGAVSIFLSAEGDAADISDEKRSFLDYLTTQRTGSDFTRKLEDAVRKAKERREWSVEYMTLFEIRERDREEGRKEGRKEGREEGRKEGRKEGREEGRKEGREEGRKEGRKEGREEGRIATLHYDMKLSSQEIAEEVGKPVEYVEKIIREMSASD